MGKKEEGKVIFNIDKEKNFSEWFTEIIKSAELADIRYNVKGFVVFQPWSVLAMEEMYSKYERALQRKGHKPYFYPVVIPESNFKLEASHVEGFAPEVFWVTEHGAGEKLEEKLALRPTSETAFYKMFAYWIRSYNDLPFKTYQRGSVYRHETKATRPFIRSREFHWIEAHDAFANEEDAVKQVKEDMQTTKEVMHDQFGIPFMFFKRPSWDKFPGAVNTYAADCLMPDGKILQLPSTHLLGTNFSKPFDVKYADKDGEEKHCYLTCYGPSISRIFAALIATHGDNKGLVFPFDLAPVQVVIVPIGFEKDSKVRKKAEELKEELWDNDFRAEVDFTDKRPGEKFYYWEMKGVPLRIELGSKELKEEMLTLTRRDTGKKEKIKEKELFDYIEKTGKDILKTLVEKADKVFDNAIVDAKNADDVKEIVESGRIARAGFCSVDEEGEDCAEAMEKGFGGRVRGTRVDLEETADKCVVCGKSAKEVVYIGKQY